MKPALLICIFAISRVFTSPAGKSIGGAGGYHTNAGGPYGQQSLAGSAYRSQSGGSVQYGHQTGDGGQQYFNRNQDGSYDFGYNTGTGAFQSERKTSGGQVTGKYGHSGPDGSFVNVEYSGVSTGDGGQYSGGSQGRSYYSSGAQSSGQYSSGYPSAPAYRAPAPVAPSYRAPAPVAPSYRAPAPVAPSYRAPAPVAPTYRAPAPLAPAYGSAGSTQSQYKASQYSQNLGAYAPSGPSRPAEYAAFNLERKGDGSYSYSYSSSDGAKTESGSPDGQVEGSFSFRGDDGVQRSIGYSAGQQGFLATGAHIPTTADGTPAAGTSTGGALPSAPSYSGGGGAYNQGRYAAKAGQGSYGYQAQQQLVAPAVRPQAYSAGAGSAKAYQYGGGSSGYSSGQQGPVDESPKPFAFSYSAGDHGRQESQDATGVVRGSYVVNSPDGSQKELTYQADDSGFHIVNEKQVQTGGGSSAYTGGQSTYSGGQSAYSGGQGYSSGQSAYSSGQSAFSSGAPGYSGGAGAYQAPRTAAGGYQVASQHYNQKSGYNR